MAFVASLAYVALALTAPWEAFPALAELRIMFWLMGGIWVITFFQVIFGRVSLWVPQIPLLVTFLFLTMLSVAVTGWFGGAVIAFSQVMVPLSACIVLVAHTTSPSRARWLCRSLVLVGIYLSVRGILAVGFGIDLDTYAMAEKVNGDEQGTLLVQVYRARGLGLLNDPNDLAQYLVACLPLAVLPWRRGRIVGNFVQVVVPISLMLVAFFLTRSRGGLVALAFLVTLAASRISRFAALVSGVGVLGGMLALGFSGGRAASISEGTGGGRIAGWSDALVAFGSHPIFGVGYGNINDYMSGYTAHNSYLLCLAETGVFGLFFWLAAFTVTFFQVRPLLTDPNVSEESRRSSRLYLLSLASAMVAGFFLSRTYSLTLYIFLGLLTSAFVLARSEQSEPCPLFRSSWLAWNGMLAFLLIATIYVLVRLHWMSA